RLVVLPAETTVKGCHLLGAGRDGSHGEAVHRAFVRMQALELHRALADVAAKGFDLRVAMGPRSGVGPGAGGVWALGCELCAAGTPASAEPEGALCRQEERMPMRE